MSYYYTGIGSRKTPQGVLNTMTILASNLELTGLILRSGGADGADSAFEAGVKDSANKSIFLPWKGFNKNPSEHYTISPEAYEMAEHYHPAWNRCSFAARQFHARNCYQVLGLNLATPSQFIVCWTPDGKHVGGTGQALRIATDHNIPIFNMAHTASWESSFDHFMMDWRTQ